MNKVVPASAVAEGTIEVPAAAAPTKVQTPIADIGCWSVLKACCAFTVVDAFCCAACCCHCCGGCCGKYDSCVMGTAVADTELGFGATKPGPDRCQLTCMIDMYACSSAIACCGCFLCCCGLGAPVIKGLVHKTEKNGIVVPVPVLAPAPAPVLALNSVKPVGPMVR
jgi:hypothetical protein